MTKSNKHQQDELLEYSIYYVYKECKRRLYVLCPLKHEKLITNIFRDLLFHISIALSKMQIWTLKEITKQRNPKVLYTLSIYGTLIKVLLLNFVLNILSVVPSHLLVRQTDQFRTLPPFNPFLVLGRPVGFC